MAGTKVVAEEFARQWANRGNEDQDTQLFWVGLLQDVLGLNDALERLKFEQPVHTKASDYQGFIDVLIPSASTIVEQKSLGVPLDKPETRQGRKVTPAQQALAYTEGLPLSQKPRYVVACNFAELWVYDTEADPLCKHDPLVIALASLPKNLPAIQFLAGRGEAPATVSEAVSVEAGKIMGRLHDLAASGYDDPDAPEAHHALSVLMTRLMFLMFCEDAGLVAPNAFHDFVQHYEAEDLADGLSDLFRWLDTPDGERAGSRKLRQPRFAAMPYMDGGLFREGVELPMLDETFRTTLLVDGCQEFDWSGVSPTVFGSIFEGALSHDHRRANGQHFTSPANIHKVIDPLFMDGLEREFAEACARPVAGGARTRALQDLHERLGRISVLDPAAGSGNFLTESYLCLRRLENRVLFELAKLREGGQQTFSFEELGQRDVLVSLRNFHGIELEDFACCVARTALWIAEKQADAETAKVTQRVYQELPLTDYAGIVQGNALRMDWNDVVPAGDVSFVCGNPPFIGHQWRTKGQQEDMEDVFKGVRAHGKLDYVCAWYEKAAGYIGERPIRCAFVSTNSICQGESVGILWRHLAERGISIDFAHTTFVWDSQSDDEAHVHVVIVGFGHGDNGREKRLFSAGRDERRVPHINGYLSPAPDVFIENRGKPVNDGVPDMTKGSQPTDGGNLILTGEERRDLVARHPDLNEVIRPYVGGREFLNGGDRWCLWFAGRRISDYAYPEIRERLQAVKAAREASPTASVRAAAATPWLFTQNRQPDTSYLGVPEVSSGRRRYVQIGYMPADVIASNQLRFIPTDSLFVFGLLSSYMHAAWMRVVAGRLKSDYRYSPAVYNSFVFPECDEASRRAIERAAQGILDARGACGDEPLAKLYDPENEIFYPELYAAHSALDAAVEAAYGVDFQGDEERIVAHLFGLYAQRVNQG